MPFNERVKSDFENAMTFLSKKNNDTKTLWIYCNGNNKIHLLGQPMSTLKEEIFAGTKFSGFRGFC